jgi:hypothetical protein
MLSLPLASHKNTRICMSLILVHVFPYSFFQNQSHFFHSQLWRKTPSKLLSEEFFGDRTPLVVGSNSVFGYASGSRNVQRASFSEREHQFEEELRNGGRKDAKSSKRSKHMPKCEKFLNCFPIVSLHYKFTLAADFSKFSRTTSSPCVSDVPSFKGRPDQHVLLTSDIRLFQTANTQRTKCRSPKPKSVPPTTTEDLPGPWDVPPSAIQEIIPGQVSPSVDEAIYSESQRLSEV